MKKLNSWLAVMGLLAVNPITHAATFDVSTVSEFRTALNSAANNNEDNVINLAAGTYLTTEDAGGAFLYNSTTAYSLTLQDDDLATANDVFLDGDTVDEVIILKSEVGGGTYTIKGLTLQHGTRGARVEKANLTIENCQFLENINLSTSDDGAGLFFDQSSYDLNISNSHFSLNSVSDYRYGGAAYIRAKNLSINNSVFDQNNAGRDGGALHIRGIDYRGSAIIQFSEFTNNTADKGGAIYSNANNLSVEDSQFQQNSATNQGGAISGSLESVNRSSFIGNTSSITVAALSGASKVYNSIFSGNIVTNLNYGAGRTIDCNNCRIINNLFDNNSVNAELFLASGYNSDSNVIANTVFLNTQNNLLLSAYTNLKATLKNNFFDSSLIGLPAEQVFQTGNFFSGNPGLNENYNILSDSELINAGYTDAELFSLPLTDFLGNGRVAGSAVDIGPIEYGSSVTLPQITSYSLLTSTPKNLQSLSFGVSYTLFGERTLSSLGFDDGAGTFSSIELDQNGQFQYQFIEPGNKTTRLKVVDSEGEESINSISIFLNAQSINDVISLTKDGCKSSPTDCNIDTNSYYNSGYTIAMTECEQNPALCGVNTETYITIGKNVCIEDPSVCGIKADFDYTKIPSTSAAGWKLLGTSEPILNMTQFENVKVVWTQINGTWYAYSPDNAIASALSAKNIPKLNSISAYSGFWVTK